uniref:Dipeptidase n=1 Tax=Scleropages formosus TaxID=113540 RepID=A0A8C9VW10_SCLFO
ITHEGVLWPKVRNLCWKRDTGTSVRRLHFDLSPCRHNDLPWQLRSKFNNQLNNVDLNTLNSTHTNIPKIKAGRLAAQFWAAYVPCDTQNKDAVRQTLEQIDVIHRMCEKYPEDFMFATSSRGQQAFTQNKMASLIGVEGGHSMDSSLATLRTLYQLGVLGTAPALHPLVSPCSPGLIPPVIKEMNRLGMMVDLAHVSERVMKQVLNVSEAPVIFSHSSAYGVCPHKRNVPDDILKLVKEKEGVVMVNFYNDYVTCSDKANLSQVADHFDHIKKVAGASIIGFGGDYDGVERVPEGLENVSKYPALVAELLRRNWTNEEVQMALGKNLLRVFEKVEQHQAVPSDVLIPYERVKNTCRTSYGYDVPSSGGDLLALSHLLLVLCALLSLL